MPSSWRWERGLRRRIRRVGAKHRQKACSAFTEPPLHRPTIKIIFSKVLIIEINLSIMIFTFAGIAQLVEQRIRNAQVACSSHVSSSKKSSFNRTRIFYFFTINYSLFTKSFHNKTIRRTDFNCLFNQFSKQSIIMVLSLLIL